MPNFWDKVCEEYLRIVVDEASALEKVSSELEGCWKNAGFDERLKDSFLELEVVCDLYHLDIISNVVPQSAPVGKRAPDFTCSALINGSLSAACLEVKNIRAPKGILQTFQQLLPKARSKNASLSNVNLSLTYYWDHTVSADQESVIQEFLEQLVVFPLSPHQSLYLPSGTESPVEVHVELVPGYGDICLVRSEGGSYPVGPQINSGALIDQVKSKLDRAIPQLQCCGSEARLLALNIDWPMVMFRSDHDRAIRQAVSGRSSNVECFLFHNHQFFDRSLKTLPNWILRYR